MLATSPGIAELVELGYQLWQIWGPSGWSSMSCHNKDNEVYQVWQVQYEDSSMSQYASPKRMESGITLEKQLAASQWPLPPVLLA